MNPQAYLAQALDVIEHHSVMRDQVNWPALRREAGERAAGAATSAATYPAIRLALARLGDRHSLFLDPDEVRGWHAVGRQGPGIVVKHPEGIVIRVFSGGAAERAGLKVSDRLLSVNGEPLGALDTESQRTLLTALHLDVVLARPGELRARSVSLTSTPYCPHLLPRGRQLSESVGLLELPAHMGHGDSDDERLATDQQYAATDQQIIDGLEERGVRGWVVDLRRNTGGNMLPMLLAVGRLIGKGECLGFVYPTHRVSVEHDQGVILVENKPLLRLNHPSPHLQAVPVVAILTSPLTASSGELVALAFQGRPRTHRFGEATSGVPTDNEPFNLPDGARLLLTVALGADRTGQVYDGPLIPDQHVSINWQALESDDDPVVRAASAWIEEQQ